MLKIIDVLLGLLGVVVLWLGFCAVQMVAVQVGWIDFLYYGEVIIFATGGVVTVFMVKLVFFDDFGEYERADFFEEAPAVRTIRTTSQQSVPLVRFMLQVGMFRLTLEACSPAMAMA